MSIRRTRTGRYEVRWREGSSHRARSFDRRKDAQAFEAERRRREQLGAHAPAEPSREPLREWLDTWWTREGPGWRQSTRVNRGALLDRWILPFIGDVSLRDLGEDRVDQWRSDILAEGCPHQQANDALTVLSSAPGPGLGGAPPLQLQPAPPGPTLAPTCRGRNATIVGTSGNDVIRGTVRADVIHSLRGNDRVLGLGGNDIICLGAGRDRGFGGAGRDTILGEAGPDQIRGQGGNDLLLGAAGNDTIRGGAGRDTVRGGAGVDRIFGNGGPDRLFGGTANDRILGQSGNDLLVGNGGRDTGIGGPGRDRFRSIEIRRP